jgi:ribosomal protein S8
MLTRIRNGSLARHSFTRIQYSKLNFLIDGSFIFNILLISAGLTTFYSFKLMYIIFIKKPTIEINKNKKRLGTNSIIFSLVD